MFKRQNLLLIALGIAVAIGAAFYLSGRETDQALLTTETLAGSGTDRELVSTLLALRAVTLDGSIFEEPSFTVLTDSSSPIIPEPIGRPNPFAPFNAPATSTSSDNIRAFGNPRQ